MFNVEVVGDRELATRFEGMAPAVRQMLVGKMRSETELLRDAVKANLSVYAAATQENHGPSGKLAASIQIEVLDNETEIIGRVFPDEEAAPYARVQEKGGGQGATLAPVNADMMRFIWHGEEWFSRLLIRGETPAKRYLRDALDAEGSKIIERLHTAVAEEMQRKA